MGWSQLRKAVANKQQSPQRIREAQQSATQERKKKSRAVKGQRLSVGPISMPLIISLIQFKKRIIQIALLSLWLLFLPDSAQAASVFQSKHSVPT